MQPQDIWNYPGFSINGESYDYRAAMYNNWMYVVLNEWTISHRSDYTANSYLMNATVTLATSALCIPMRLSNIFILYKFSEHFGKGSFFNS